MTPIQPTIKLWLDLSGLLADAAETSAKQLRKKLGSRRRSSCKTRHPGAETPLWNACVVLLRAELKPFGSKVRLARFLGIPKQRLNDFLTGRSRLPDAELMLQMLNWLAQKRAGRDLAL